MTRAKNKRQTSFAKKWILAINLFFVLLLLLTYATPFVPVQKWGWLSLLALAYPFCMLLNGCFAFVWIMVRSWFWVFSIFAILIGFNVHSRYVKFISLGHGKVSCDETIRVLSYNMRGLTMVPTEKGSSKERKVEYVYNAISEEKEYPDIFW